MKSIERVLIQENPFTRAPGSDCQWLTCPGAPTPPFVAAYRLRFQAAKTGVARIHVTADERYELFLDGKRIATGSERGDAAHWFFETYDVTLSKGGHVLVARVRALGALAPEAQMSVAPGFILLAEGSYRKLLSTGTAAWEAKRVEGYEFDGGQGFGGHYFAVGCRFGIDGERYPWGVEAGKGEGWQVAPVGDKVRPPQHFYCHYNPPQLVPATLPAMLDVVRKVGRAVFISEPKSMNVRETAVRRKEHRAAEVRGWDLFLRGKNALTIPARTLRRVIVDLDNYYCGYTTLVTSDGRGSRLAVNWTEALFCEKQAQTKGNRNEIEGKFFFGLGDVYKPEGGRRRVFEPLWWNAGRYLELVIETGDEALTLEKFAMRETRYPLEAESRFAASDKRLERVIPIGLRGLQMCSHETYMDCPFYEQLMYVGDTRLEVLTTMALTRDDRLPRKALAMFEASHGQEGLTKSRYPSHTPQIIPPFSLWWVAMAHDYARWRGDKKFIASLMPGVRSVIETFWAHRTADGLVRCPDGWPFMDWVPGWGGGVPVDGRTDASGLINWQMAWVLTQAAELEQWMEEPELAARNLAQAHQLAANITRTFWDERRGLFADDRGKKHFSEHSQCLAMLSGLVEPVREHRVGHALLHDRKLDRTTIYFTHYLFEAYRKMGAMEEFLKRMQLWFDLEGCGAKTTIEMPEPTRSDCHAWGAHPIYHYFASILGIRPASMGFETVRIEPQLGPLKSAKGSLVHPAGKITVEFQARRGGLEGVVILPEGVTGNLVYGGVTLALEPGRQTIRAS